MKRYLYYDTLEDAQKAIETINAAQNREKVFFNIELKQTNNGKFAVIVG